MLLFKEVIVVSLSMMSSQFKTLSAQPTSWLGRVGLVRSAFQNLTEMKKWWFLSTKLLSVKHRRAQLASDFYDYVCRYIRALGRQADRLGARRLVEAIGLLLVGT